MKHVVMFSGGLSSWAAAKRVAAEHGTDDLVLLFSDTLMCHLKTLRKRDGDHCRQCGPSGKFLEVDHRVPLWKVVDLPSAKRRQYFLIGNLQLLCFDCHKRKSAKEAAERAHHRRLAKGKKRRGRAMQSRGFDTRWPRRMDGRVEVRT